MLITKPPIVVILGHIDHGKTTLLDCLRKTNLVLKEDGGITQKIGAYEIEFLGQKLTFIDTPGHEAFSLLRQRGVKVADLGVLVIASDEGIKLQTKESLEYLKLAKIPFIVALSKIDKKEADVNKVISQLIELEVIPEKWGGEVPLVEICAPKNQGINDLLEILLLLRDINDLKVEIYKPGRGFILEVIKDWQRGILATAIVTEGRINYGDYLITKNAFAKIKIFEDDLGKKINEALPSKPFLVGNFEGLPLVGEEFQVGNENEIKKIQKEFLRDEEILKKKIILQETEDKKEGDFALILKADNFGSLEALEKVFFRIAKKNNLNLKILKADLGEITLEDLNLAKNFKGIIISFNVKNKKSILEMIKNFNFLFFESNVIYDLEEKFINYFQQFSSNNLPTKGKLEVLAIFGKTKTKKTIGGKVIAGKLKVNQKVFIQRGEKIIIQGKILSLEKNKLPSGEVNENDICGLIIETEKDIEINDYIVVI